MRALLLFVLLSIFTSFSGWANTYSCRDSQGQIHFSDNLQGLPEECLGKEQVVKPDAPDNLNYVPPVETPAGVGKQFEREAREVERGIEQKKEQERRLLVRSETLSNRFVAAQQKKRQAKRVWHANSRETIKQADAEIAQVLTEKQELLQELEVSRISTEAERKVRDTLQAITSE